MCQVGESGEFEFESEVVRFLNLFPRFVGSEERAGSLRQLVSSDTRIAINLLAKKFLEKLLRVPARLVANGPVASVTAIETAVIQVSRR